jgi:uncharacterized membrane protein
MASRGKFKDTDMQLVIGWILRGGVTVSMVIVVIGGVLFIYRHGHSVPDFSTFKGTPGFISTPKGVFQNAFQLKGQAIIQLGIALLIATPILRVVFAAVGFILEKDYLYTLISVIVLLVIIISMITGHIG